MHGMADVLHVEFRLCFCSYVLTPLHSISLQAFAFRPLLFRFLSLCCKVCVSLCVCSLQSKCLKILNLINQIPPPPAIVQCPIVFASSGFDDSSTPLLTFSICIYIPTFLYLNCFLHSVICYVHCALSVSTLVNVYVALQVFIHIAGTSYAYFME